MCRSALWGQHVRGTWTTSDTAHEDTLARRNSCKTRTSGITKILGFRSTMEPLVVRTTFLFYEESNKHVVRRTGGSIVLRNPDIFMISDFRKAETPGHREVEVSRRDPRRRAIPAGRTFVEIQSCVRRLVSTTTSALNVFQHLGQIQHFSLPTLAIKTLAWRPFRHPLCAPWEPPPAAPTAPTAPRKQTARGPKPGRFQPSGCTDLCAAPRPPRLLYHLASAVVNFEVVLSSTCQAVSMSSHIRVSLRQCVDFVLWCRSTNMLSLSRLRSNDSPMHAPSIGRDR